MAIWELCLQLENLTSYIVMKFVSFEVVLLWLYLPPYCQLKKVYIPNFERKMTVKKPLSVVKFLFQTMWRELFQFQNPKGLKVFTSQNCAFIFAIFSIRSCNIKLKGSHFYERLLVDKLDVVNDVLTFKVRLMKNCINFLSVL